MNENYGSVAAFLGFCFFLGERSRAKQSTGDVIDDVERYQKNLRHSLEWST